jgi:hypothetical protein
MKRQWHLAMANFSGPPPVKLATPLLDSGSASQKVWAKVWVTESREVLASVGLRQQQSDR